ncbi:MULTISPECIES: J domain-containing protein [unclassified Prochlorococcus]|uniref:J domain-containing protein n=1 Tax=unclassified Prochlorococcus TaxID=2627481 RepID=UPI0005338DA2|nr:MULTISPECIES: DnaJ domain-containing protein [unclassified Prochlorococcus]KGG15286.1 cyanobacteria-specific chaperone containing DNAJ domain [Prochlorococcus sp. MIT 0602]KGG17563.1 cyanobacteria-specific chaperone containing DNAJ domain [Prochlorococcus sp. MIT 0603]
MPNTTNDGSKRITIDLPVDLIDRFDELKKEWGLRARGPVLERLLETIFSDDNTDKDLYEDPTISTDTKQLDIIDSVNVPSDKYLVDKAIVLINSDKIEKINSDLPSINESNQFDSLTKGIESKTSKSVGIDLPGFVRNKAEKLKKSLGKGPKVDFNYDPIVHSVDKKCLIECLKEARSHWISLYGNEPKNDVVEAAMIWLARDIWPYLDDSDSLPFTWSAASQLMLKLCHTWDKGSPSFERIIVIAGVLEDPFATDSLKKRIPTLTRRFVNSFKRRRNVTSFQTLESTMTIHGALRLLNLPITAGESVSLSTVRDAYKAMAIANHPDSGGSTDKMRKINEAYQLLKDLYKKKESQ